MRYVMCHPSHDLNYSLTHFKSYFSLRKLLRLSSTKTIIGTRTWSMRELWDTLLRYLGPYYQSLPGAGGFYAGPSLSGLMSTMAIIAEGNWAIGPATNESGQPLQPLTRPVSFQFFLAAAIGVLLI